MIEIKISTSTAVLLLTERMNYEFGLREKAKKLASVNELKDLTYNELLEIAETAAFDLVFLLPADVLMEQNNLSDIIHKAIVSLSEVYNKEEFKVYPKKNAEKLLSPILSVFDAASTENTFLSN